ncbi:MAG: DUF429 domain-containing protein [Methylotenera sp.]|nr:DUF429 domain-containing protein [Oligoflexia bacterium]
MTPKTTTEKSPELQPRRYLGLELAGAKNQKTALAALEYYPKEKKIFLLDTYDKIAAHDEQTGDDALLEVVHELRGISHGVHMMGVNVPLELPPCLVCTCTTSECSTPAASWMRAFVKESALKTDRNVRVKEITPYTQRPVELWVRYKVLENLTPELMFEIDEALGGTKAPLTARMSFLKRSLTDLSLVEVWPKLSIASLAPQLDVSKRALMSYRHLEEGVHARAELLEAFVEDHGIFIYERDVKKLTQSLTAFDAFICAYTALLSDQGRTVKMPKGFPAATGWVEYPVAPEPSET